MVEHRIGTWHVLSFTAYDFVPPDGVPQKVDALVHKYSADADQLNLSGLGWRGVRRSSALCVDPEAGGPNRI